MGCRARLDLDQHPAAHQGAYCADVAGGGKTRWSRGGTSLALQRPSRCKRTDPATLVVGRGRFRCRLHALRCMRQGMSHRNHRARQRRPSGDRFHTRRMHLLRQMRLLLPAPCLGAGAPRQHPLVAQGGHHAKMCYVQKDELLELRRFLLEARHPLSLARRRNSDSRSRSENVQGLRRLPGLVHRLRHHAQHRRSDQTARQDRRNRAAAMMCSRRRRDVLFHDHAASDRPACRNPLSIRPRGARKLCSTFQSLLHSRLQWSRWCPQSSLR